MHEEMGDKTEKEDQEEEATRCSKQWLLQKTCTDAAVLSEPGGISHGRENKTKTELRASGGQYVFALQLQMMLLAAIESFKLAI